MMRISALIAVVALMAAADAREKAPQDEIEASAKKVKELQKERITVLKEAAEASMKLAQTTRIDFSEAVEDRMALLTAELDAAESGAERISLYQKAVSTLKAYEELARAQKEAARATELSMLRIKARRLEVEIQFERARMKEPK
jgi:hypothetical protein